MAYIWGNGRRAMTDGEIRDWLQDKRRNAAGTPAPQEPAAEPAAVPTKKTWKFVGGAWVATEAPDLAKIAQATIAKSKTAQGPAGYNTGKAKHG